MGDLTIHGLAILREVAARGSFSAAADALGYTQSAVSRQVATLERAAGMPLFERRHRGVRPTRAGVALLERARVVLDEIEAATNELASARDRGSGRVRVGAFPTAIGDLLPRAIALTARSHPGIEVVLREGTTPSQLRRLAAGSADLAVVAPGADREAPPGGIRFETLLEDPLLVGVGRQHRLAGRDAIDLDELAGESWIASSRGVSKTLLAAWPRVSWQPQVRYEIREWTAKLGLVAAGLGVTLVPTLAATAVRTDVALLRIRSAAPVSRTVSLARGAAGSADPAIDAVAATLHEAAAAVAEAALRRVAEAAAS